MKKIVELTVIENDELLNVIEQSANKRGFEIESIDDVLDLVKIVADALEYMGIEAHVKWTDDDDDDDDDYDEDDYDEDMESIIYDCDGKRGISAADARLLMQCVAKTMRRQYPILSDEALEVMGMIECMRIAEIYGIEVVDTKGE